MKLAELFVQISGDSRPLNQSLQTIRLQLEGVGRDGDRAGRRATSGLASAFSRLSSLATAALVGGVAAGAGLAALGLYRAAKGASDLGETLSKVGEVFGPEAKKVEAAADDMAKKFGTPKGAFLDAAAAIGLIGRASGQTQAQAADLGADFARLAEDASSFYNVPFEEALQKIRSGLVGEAEPLRTFGVLLNEDAVKQEAFRLGLVKTKKELNALTEAQKVQARASLIRRGLGTAEGDRARTAGSAANRVREIRGRVGNALAELGQAIAPATGALISGVADVVQRVTGYFEANKAAISEWASSAAGSIAGVFGKVTEFGAAVGEFMGSQSGQLIQSGIGAAFQWLAETVGAVVSGIK